MSSDKFPPPEFGINKSDVVASGLRGALGAVPGVGSILAEIVTNLIPNQRIDRLEDYVKNLAERLSDSDAEAASLTTREAVDLFEDGAFHAARAVSDERRDRIAQIVAFGLSGDEQQRIEAKRLLSLLGEIDDDQIIILASYLHRNQNDEFRETHKSLLRPDIPTINDDNPAKRDKYALFNLSREQLVKLGLLIPQFRKPKKGEMPEFDERTGMMKSSRRTISPLGRLLLRRIGLAKDDEF